MQGLIRVRVRGMRLGRGFGFNLDHETFKIRVVVRVRGRVLLNPKTFDYAMKNDAIVVAIPGMRDKVLACFWSFLQGQYSQCTG